MEQQANRAHRPAKEKKKFEGTPRLLRYENCKLYDYEPMLTRIVLMKVPIRKLSLLPGLESSTSRLREHMMYVHGRLFAGQFMLTLIPPPG
jgi:hypothetical protein